MKNLNVNLVQQKLNKKFSQSINVYHTGNFKNRAKFTQSHGVLGMKALFKQLDQII